MQFQVPQFIEVEDKIFGPLTFKQFVYLAGAAGMSYLLWRMLPIYISMPLIALTFALGASLAFFNYNGRPFILAVEHAFYFFFKSKLYLWRNDQATGVAKKQGGATIIAAPYVPHLSESKLHELSWSLDIKERIAAGTADAEDRTDASALTDVVAPIRTAGEARIT
jgi:hypothetical protein